MDCCVKLRHNAWSPPDPLHSTSARAQLFTKLSLIASARDTTCPSTFAGIHVHEQLCSLQALITLPSRPDIVKLAKNYKTCFKLITNERQCATSAKHKKLHSGIWKVLASERVVLLKFMSECMRKLSRFLNFPPFNSCPLFALLPPNRTMAPSNWHLKLQFT